MLPLSPSKLGRYEIVDELGKGAMGVVYLARDPLIGRLVALKTFRIGYSIKDAELEQFRARFIREAQSAGILSHPNIVTIHDVVERGEEGMAFIAMEYVRGTNLKSVLQEPQRPTLTYITEILTQIADGLDYAHSCKVIHRDVKPANILITTDNRAKITDFGIARLDTSNLTQEGQLLGTPNYMSPEQILGRDVDHRADIFSLGVVLYEMVTRHKPFQGENLTVVSHRIVYDHFTPPREYADDLPPGAEQVLAKALEKDPARRYQRARDMADDLRRILGSAGGGRDLLNDTQSLSSTAMLPAHLVRGGGDAGGGAAAAAGPAGGAAPGPESGIAAAGPESRAAAPITVAASLAAATATIAAVRAPAGGLPPAAAAGMAVAGAAALATAALPRQAEAPAGAETIVVASAVPSAAAQAVPASPPPPPAAAAPSPAAPGGVFGSGGDVEAETAARTAAALHPAPVPVPATAGSPATSRPAAGRGRFGWPPPARLAAAAAAGVGLGLLLAALSWLWMRSLAGTPPTRAAARFEAAQPARVQLMALLRDGRRRLDAGDPDGAAAAYRAAEQLEPGRRGVRKLREEAELRQRDNRQRHFQEHMLESLLEEARLALAGRRYPEADAAAHAVLVLSPGNTVAVGILASVKEGRARQRDRAAPASEPTAPQAAAAASSALRPDAAARGAQAAPAAPSDAKEATIELAFFSKQPEGSLLIYVNGRKVVQESFRFYERAGLFRSRATTGWVRRSFHLPAGSDEVRIYVTPRGSAAVVRTLAGNFAAGAARRLDVQLDDGGQVTAQLN